MAFSKSVLYYSSNREDDRFEEKIRATVMDNCGKLPIVSVSQKPIDFGHNICVGDVGHSYINAFRQMLIGAKAAITDYLVFAEADFLYPKEYFDFEPDGKDLYRHRNVWVVFRKGKSAYCRKHFSNGAQIAKRDFVIRELGIYLADQPAWVDGPFRIQHPDGSQKADWNGAPFEFFGSDNCVTFKTGDGVTKSCVVMSGEENRRQSLPHWGDAHSLKRKYLG